MSRQIVVGIDIGSSETKVIIAEDSVEQGRFVPKIIGTGTALTSGVENGFVRDATEASRSVRLAVDKAEKMAGVKVKRAYVAFGGIGLSSLITTGSTATSRADMEISEKDIDTALETAEASIPKSFSINKRIINTIPVEYKLDGAPAWGDPAGLKANKLEVKTLFITCLEHHLAELIKTVEEANIEVIDVVAAPIAASFVTISKKERRVGSVLVDIGAETLSIIAFENGNPVSLEVLRMGGEDLTNDIALGLKLPLDEAEAIKIGELSRSPYSKKKLDDIVSRRLSDLFELVENHLKKIGRDQLMPGGSILSGGSAKISGLKTFAEEALRLPARVAEIHFGSGDKNKIRDSQWTVASGLILVGFNSSGEGGLIGGKKEALTREGGRILRKASRWFSQFLP